LPLCPKRTDAWVRTYYVYMLLCFDGTFYTGVTNDVVHRYDQHCSGNNETSYTYSRRPLQLVYVGEFHDLNDAIAFEKNLKGWTHEKKRAFAERDWPLLKQLAMGRDRPPLSSRAESRDGHNRDD
jgi:putative endonuclease